MAFRGKERGTEVDDYGRPAARAKAAPPPGKRTLTDGLVRRDLEDGGDQAPVASAADVVEQAVATRDTGAPVAASIRAAVEPELGVSLDNVRIHGDDSAREAASAIGARAFTYQSDVFLGPGASAGDLGLMAHELTHVAQQGAGAPGVQRQLAIGASDHPAEREADAVADRVTAGTGAPTQLIVDDGAPRSEGQLGRSEFLAALRTEVTAAATGALGPEWSAQGCPTIEGWFAQHASTDAATLERLARRYAGQAQATSARALIAPICARLAGAITRWRGGGDISADLSAAGVDPATVAPASMLAQAGAGIAGALSSASSAVASAGSALSSALGMGGATAQAKPGPQGLVHELGPGQPLSGAGADVAAGFEGLGAVQIHTGAVAQRKADELDARAFAVGPHIGFAAGEFRPGEPEGDALLAHELAHVQQQSGASSAGTGDGGGSAVAGQASKAHEDDADQAATSVMSGLYGSGRRAASTLAQRARAAATSGLEVQRCGRSPSGAAPAPPAPAPAVPTTHGPDQHAGALQPNADQVTEIGYQLDPSSRPAPVVAPTGPSGAPAGPVPAAPPRQPWDGATGQPNEAARRTELQNHLFTATTGFLNRRTAAITAALGQSHVSMAGTGPAAPGTPPGHETGVVDIANAAVAQLEARYGAIMNAAASTPKQAADRAPRSATPGAGQNLFDSTSEADRATQTNTPNLQNMVAWWIAQHDDATGPTSARAGMTAHRFSTQDPGADQFLRSFDAAYSARSDFPGGNARKLIDYRMTQWSERGTRGITLQSGFDPGADAQKAERTQRWSVFKTAVHECLHLRAHPAFAAIQGNSPTLIEGFTEMFTEEVLNAVLPRASAGSEEALRRTVEGGVFTPVDPTCIGAFQVAGEYAGDFANAKTIRDGNGTPAFPGVGADAVRAAFFQGHLEMIGLSPSGMLLTGAPAAGAARRTRIPTGMTGLDDLARRSGVARATIERDNAGITDALPADAVLAGCREHLVVAITTSNPTSGATDSGVETRAQIATQNGVSEADLVRANPDVAVDAATNGWPTLTGGQRLLIPVH